MISCWITIDPRVSQSEQWEIVVHEWAHCLDRDSGRVHALRDCHDTRWGQHYSRAYRASVSL